MRAKKYGLLLILALGLCQNSTQSAEGQSDQNNDPSKPLVVLIFDQTCKVWCQKVKPVISQLQDEYKDRVAFVQLDSTPSQLPQSKKIAKDLRILGFFSDAADYVPEVLIFTGARKLVKELPGPKTKEEYEANINKALAQK